MKDKYEEQNRLQIQFEQEKVQLKNLKIKLEDMSNDNDNLARSITRTERDVRNLNDVLEDAGRKISSMEKQKNYYSEDKETNQLVLVNLIQELVVLQTLIPDIYADASGNSLVEQLSSVSQLKKNCENGKV